MPSFDGFLTPNVITNYPRGQSKNSENVKCKWNLHITFTRRRSWRFAEYCKRFVARLNDVHAFGYNSAESERIWMKFGELWDYCSELSLTNFGRDPRRRGSGRASRNFVFFGPLNDARFHRLPIGQISGNLHTRLDSVTWWILSDKFFENLEIKVDNTHLIFVPNGPFVFRTKFRCLLSTLISIRHLMLFLILGLC